MKLTSHTGHYTDFCHCWFKTFFNTTKLTTFCEWKCLCFPWSWLWTSWHFLLFLVQFQLKKDLRDVSCHIYLIWFVFDTNIKYFCKTVGKSCSACECVCAHLLLYLAIYLLCLLKYGLHLDSLIIMQTGNDWK